MDKFEFMLRYMGYEWLNEKFNFWWDEETILKLSNRTNLGKMNKKLTETTPDELKKLTIETYTDFKKDFIEKKGKKKIVNNFTLGDYIERLEYEYKVVHEMWYNTYFLIVQDYIMYAKKSGIVVWPGRWSAAGSLLSYLIRITEIDPMPYDLLFERFLNPARISMPDVDTDFEDTEREKIIEYVKKIYGVEKVAQIGTYMTMAAKAAFKDVARTFGLSFTKSNQLSNYIEKSIDKSLENEEFANIINDDENLQKIVKLASRLEWTVRQVWVHACGVVISPEEIQEYSPVQHPPKSWQKGEQDANRIVTQYDGHCLEDIGLLKMDFLGLRNLSIIKNTIKILKAKLPEWKKLDNIYEEFFKYMVFEPPLEDEKTLDLFRDGNTSGVFQFESDGMRWWLKKLKPSSIDDIVAMVALYRPGPMDWIPNYIARKNGEEEISYLPDDVYQIIEEKYGKKEAENQKKMITKDLQWFMDVTYGISIYQEQLMRIVQSMAGFSLGEADLLRRWVGKKIMEVIAELKKDFIKGASSFRWYKEEVSIYVYESMIEPAANYSFNKSHAVCYAIIAYQTAYLKAHHPIEFHAALLRSVEENTDKLAELIDELKIKWFKVTSPNINKSFAHVAAINDDIVIWLVAVKWLGYDLSKEIEEERTKNGKFKNLEDFLVRCEDNINRKSLESLAKSGALDDWEDRKILLDNTDLILKRVKWRKEHQKTSSMWLFGDELLESSKLELKPWKKASIMENLKYEYETIGTFLSSHPFDGLYSYLKSKTNFISQVLDKKYDGDFNILWIIKSIKKNNKFGGFWISVEDITWTMDIYMKNIWSLWLFDVVLLKWKFYMTEQKIKSKDKKNINENINKSKEEKKDKQPDKNLKKEEFKQVRRRKIVQISKINLDIYIDKIKRNKKYNEEEKVVLVRHNRNEAQKKKAIEETLKIEQLKKQLDNKKWKSHNLKTVTIPSIAIEEEISTSENCDSPKLCDGIIDETNKESGTEDKEYEIETIEEEKIKKEIKKEKSNKKTKEKKNISITKDNGKIIEKELPDNIDDIMKIAELKKTNPKQDIIEYKWKFYKV